MLNGIEIGTQNHENIIKNSSVLEESEAALHNNAIQVKTGKSIPYATVEIIAKYLARAWLAFMDARIFS